MEEHYYADMYRYEATHWWYRVRRIMVNRIVASLAKKRATPLRILDIGCGTGLLLEELQKYGDASGIDMSERAIDYCRERGLSKVALGDATRLQFPDGSLDVVVILDVIEHIEDDAAACRELARVLAPGGVVIAMVPAFMFLWGITDVLSHHFRRYQRPEIVARLKGAGLSIKRATYFNTFLFPLIALVRISIRLLKIPVTSESEMGGSFANAILYMIFRLESIVLNFTNFPFGVSILVIAQKHD